MENVMLLKNTQNCSKRLNDLKGMSCRDIGEEKCSELFSQVKSEVDGDIKKFLRFSYNGL